MIIESLNRLLDFENRISSGYEKKIDWELINNWLDNPIKTQ
jgi:hypothetical protein